MSKLVLSVLISSLWLAPVFGQTPPPSQTELNGFLLGQYAAAPDGAFGKPSQVTTTDDHWIYRVYIFDKQHSAYMAFKFPGDDEKRMWSIQIAGDKGTSMRPFLGLSLGDDSQKVLHTLGKPDKIEVEKDYPVDLYTYKDRNYSLEINKQGKVSSIQIMGYAGFPHELPKGEPDIDALKKSIVARDVDGLLTQLAGDLEIYKGDKTVSFARSARTDLMDDKSAIRQMLLGGDGSLRSAFMSEPFEPDQQIRIYTKAAPGSVVKFPKSKIIREVVYKVAPGSWKIWEIRFR